MPRQVGTYCAFGLIHITFWVQPVCHLSKCHACYIAQDNQMLLFVAFATTLATTLLGCQPPNYLRLSGLPAPSGEANFTRLSAPICFSHMPDRHCAHSEGHWKQTGTSSWHLCVPQISCRGSFDFRCYIYVGEATLRGRGYIYAVRA